jgi:hypothetical protein
MFIQMKAACITLNRKSQKLWLLHLFILLLKRREMFLESVIQEYYVFQVPVE